ncbi:MAG: hypothetical protein M1819_003443 [Sarea resinae]|nr:MAG: hypothetical protein M1819_003443 [Sarea resinae]
MSGVPSWLQKQRKSDLTELAEKVGLKSYEGLKKDDLAAALDEHMRSNQSTLSQNSTLAPFYKRIASPSSPVKRETAAPASDGEPKSVKPRARRVTKAKEEIEPTTDESTPDRIRSALTTRTPRSSLSFPASVPLPPSPAVVTDVIERNTATMRTKISSLWSKAGVSDHADDIRETLSSAVSVEAVILLTELWFLRSEILPSRYAFSIPAVPAIGLKSDYPVKILDFFLLLTSSFWAPFTLWLTTSLFAPLGFAYFFNLTLQTKPSHATRGATNHVKQFDPLTFNIVKALVTYLVYGQGVTFGGYVGDESAVRVDGAMPGGYRGVLIGAAIGALTSVYEAVLKK